PGRGARAGACGMSASRGLRTETRPVGAAGSAKIPQSEALQGALLLVLRKELLELRRSPVLLLSMVSLPATVVAVPVVLLWWLVRAAPEPALAFVQDVYGVQAEG